MQSCCFSVQNKLENQFFFTVLIDVAVVVDLAPYNCSEAAVFDSSRNNAPQERCATKQKQLRVRLAVVGFHGFVGSSKSTRGAEGNVKKNEEPFRKKQNGKAAITG